MKKTCETCRHRRDFKVIGVEVFPSICKAPTAKKHDFVLRFTDVMRKDGWLKAWLFNTCGKRGRWWEMADVDVLLKRVWEQCSVPLKSPKQDVAWLDEAAEITPKQWEDLGKSIDGFKSTVLPKPARPAPPMPKIKPPKE